MIPALIIGRAGSKGFPNKNYSPVLGRPLCAYPLMAAHNSQLTDAVFVATDSEPVAEIGRRYGAQIIPLPDNVANGDSFGAFKYGLEVIKRWDTVEMIVLLFCNGATIRPGIIDEGIISLRNEPALDSAVTVSCYNMRSPLRAHRLTDENLLEPCFPHNFFEGASCDRNSQGDVWFPDCSAFVVRPHCFRDCFGVPPFPWIGRAVRPLKQWGGLDIDFEWQAPQAEFWLRAHGFTEDKTPYDDPDSR